MFFNKIAKTSLPSPIMSVIIPAGGSGTRMGGVSKPLLPICNKEMILYSVESFLRSAYVSCIVIAAKGQDEETMRELIKKHGFEKRVFVTQGADSRQGSVLNAFRFLADKGLLSTYIAVHDAARPLIRKEDIDSAVECAIKHKNAVCAVRATDTQKRTDKDGFITEAVDRENLWQIQTPQIFLTDVFHASLAVAKKDSFEATDESSLVAHAGFKVKLHMCSYENIKVTYPEDVRHAEFILECRKA